MKHNWFKRSGWIYLPVHAMGLLISLLTISLVVPACMTALRHSRSANDDLYTLFIYATCTAFWWKWIAEKTSA